MGVFKWIVALSVLAVGLLLASYLTTVPETPTIKVGWWGRGPSKPDTDTTIKKFVIKVEDKELEDMKKRIVSTRFGEDLENTQFQYGFQVSYMKEVIRYWIDNFHWRTQEKELNKYEHFKTKIEGIDVHFLRAKPTGGVKGKPLLLIHGWPGSVWEFYKILPLLTNPVANGGTQGDVFDVICPSIPGYGWSEAPHQQGFDSTDAARVFVELMKRLGHDKFYVQGGDWGSLIGTNLAQAFPEKVIGLHLNMFTPPTGNLVAFLHQVGGGVFPSLFLKESDRKKLYPFGDIFNKLMQESGYMHIQATKPDTVAMALHDSPVGLAAYILEKFSTWTNPAYRGLPDGGLTKHYTLDDLLTNVMIYYTTRSVGSSMRFYKESLFTDDVRAWEPIPVEVPSGLASFPNELIMCPEALAKYKFKNVVQFTDLPRGGHFAAFEEPHLLYNDFVNFVRKVEKLKKDSKK